MKEGRPFGFAGLWERWEPEGQDPVESCTIIVTTANGLIGQIHDRMPVILSPDNYDLWLDPNEQATDKLIPLLKPYPDQEMEMWPVSLAVNSPKHEGVDLTRRL